METLSAGFAGALAESATAPVELPVADEVAPADATFARRVESLDVESESESRVDESAPARVESLRTSGVSRTT